MLYCVRMDVRVPHDLGPEQLERLKAEEKARAQELQRAGRWRHLWRVAGQYANISVFDVADNDELHALLWSLPLFPFMDIAGRRSPDIHRQSTDHAAWRRSPRHCIRSRPSRNNILGQHPCSSI
jgi:muconolactone D-isomerase